MVIGPLEPPFLDVTVEVRTFVAFQQAREVLRSNACHARHLNPSQGFGQVLVDERDGTARVPILTSRRRRFDRAFDIAYDASVVTGELECGIGAAIALHRAADLVEALWIEHSGRK